MNFASSSAWVGLNDDLDEEEVRAESLELGLGAVANFAQPHSQPSASLEAIPESEDDLLASGVGGKEERKLEEVAPESSEGFRIPGSVGREKKPLMEQRGGVQAQKRKPAKAPQIFHQQVDSNVVDIPLNVLKEETPIATGDPQFCHKCSSLLSAISTLLKKEEGVFEWECEFCGEKNEVRMEEGEVPKDRKLTYVTENQAEVEGERAGNAELATIIFVVDTSGSMCVTQPAPGKFALKTNHLSDEFRGLLHYDEADQYFGGWDRNTTYISRLQCVQAAIEAQILEVAASAPERHVGLVTFSEEVKVVGDGTNEVVVAGDKLNSIDSCLREVQGRYAHFLGKPIRETKDVLLGKVMAMEEKGATALGPAALIAVALAKEAGPGSKVILCTDGIANVGLGSLEVASDSSASFYPHLSTLAKDASISVSILSIEGEECKLNSLLPLALETGGDVKKVNPLKLREDFANVLASKTVATSVEITVNLHKALKFRNADEESLQLGGSRLIRKLGTVCENESFIFEYCRKPLKQLQEEGVDVAGLRQVLVRYRRSDGILCVFSDTEVQDVTSDREAALQQAHYDILSRNAQQVSSLLAMQGRYTESHVNAIAWGQAMQRNQYRPEQVASTSTYLQSSEPLYEVLRMEMVARPQAEERERARNQSDTVALNAHSQQRGSRR